jgi:hypothetical protein
MAAVDCGEVASGYTWRLWGMAAGRSHGGCGVAAWLLRVSASRFQGMAARC